MSDISINIEELVDIAPKIDKISSRANEIGVKLTNMEYRIDNNIRYRKNIGLDFEKLRIELDNLAENITLASDFVEKAASSYKDADKKLLASLNGMDQTTETAAINETNSEDSFSIIDIFNNILDSIHSLLQSGMTHLLEFFSNHYEVINNKPVPISGIPDIEGIISLENSSEYNYYVKLLQQRLNILGYRDYNGEPLIENGFFDVKTYELVKKFKADNKLWDFDQYEGKVGETTWHYLFHKSVPKDSTNIPKLQSDLKYNKTEYNEYVKILQKRLNELGYTGLNGKPLEEHGYFRTETLEAVNRFKKDKNLWNFKQYEGRVGETTWEHLFKENTTTINNDTKEESTSNIKDIKEETTVKTSTRKYGNPSYTEIVNYIETKCNELGLPPDIGLAIAWTESEMIQYKGNNQAIPNHNKNSSTDWGIMQLNDRYFDNIERIKTDWKYNVDMGLKYAVSKYKLAIKNNEADPARATYSAYNTGSNMDRYRTEKDARDIRFYNKYKSKPWEAKIDNEPKVDKKITSIITAEKYIMDDIKPWNVTKPLYTYNTKTGSRTAKTYNKLIDQFNVTSNPRYTPRNNSTYCNIFAWDVSVAMGVELPRFVKVNKIGNNEDATGESLGRSPQGLPENQRTELSANRLAIWLDAQGDNYGWREITPEEAQARANQGYMTISCINDSPNGHVQVIRPTPDGSAYDKEKGVYLAQAGGSSAISNGTYFLKRYKSVNYYKKYKFYTHD